MAQAGHKFGKSNQPKLKAYCRELTSTLMPEYPGELLWNGREPDQNLGPEEPDENYANSEIRCFVEGERKKRVSELVAKKFRQILSERMTPVTLPGQS